MRITCPNCAAEYEVDATLVPEDGRDVQCSACGHTWMQYADGRTEEVDAPAAPATDPAPEPEPEPELQPEEPDADEPPAQPRRRELDEEARRILREEAAREAQKRRERREARIETQTEMGLDTPAPRRATVRKAVEVRPSAPEPAAVTPPARTHEDAERAAAARGGVFPDIEDINSTLGTQAPAVASDTQDQGAESGGKGFRRGFATMIILGALLIFVYAMAPRLAQAVPALEPALASYVSAMNAFRIGVEDVLQAAAVRIQGLTGGES